jgi:chromate transporter
VNLLAALKVFITMAKVGLIGFGGGNAMVSLIEREVVSVRRWMDVAQFQEIIGYSYAVPGLAAGKIAAYVGYEQAGLLGMFAGLIGIWLPGMLMLFALLLLLRSFRESAWYPKVLTGVLFAAGGLIAASILSALPRGQLAPSAPRYVIGLLLAAAVFIIIVKFKQVPPALAVIAAGLLGLILF